jgi:plasmid stabilization system protein ParE
LDANLGHPKRAARPQATQTVKLIVSPDAVADLDRLRAFLIEKNPGAAQRAAGLVEAIQSLHTFPDRGRPTRMNGVRELIVPFGSSANVLRYVHYADANEIVVLRIWHGREQRD